MNLIICMMSMSRGALTTAVWLSLVYAAETHGDASRSVWKSTSASCTRQFFTKSFLGDGAAVLAPSTATPSSRRRIDGVEVDAKIQHERAVKF